MVPPNGHFADTLASFSATLGAILFLETDGIRAERPHPGCELSSLAEGRSVADRRDDCRCRHESLPAIPVYLLTGDKSVIPADPPWLCHRADTNSGEMGEGRQDQGRNASVIQ
jgi:hypothetical protein